MSDTTYELIPVENTDDLRNKFKIDQFDRYQYSKIYRINDFDCFETFDLMDIPVSSGDFFHQISSGEENRYDLISYQYYGTVKYWWVIWIANGIRNPLEPITVGSILRIPAVSSIAKLTVLRERV